MQNIPEKLKKLLSSMTVRLALVSLVLIADIIIAAELAAAGHTGWTIAMSTLGVIIVLVTNLCFYRDVKLPLDELTKFARRIAEGSYGIRTTPAGPSELVNLAEEINDMSEKIAAADKDRTEFISQVSHELRTPLTAITGWSETLAFDPSISEDSMRGIKIISSEAGRLTGMVEELLEFTRIQDGRFTLRIELIDIAAELEDSLFAYGELLRQAGMEVNYTPPEREIPLIPGDPERLRQVLLNLLDNAATHGCDGHRVDIELLGEAESVTISIRDYGRGIPEDELPHVKEKFFKGSSKDRGNGIGLAVCDEIISRHGGTLNILNAEGGGCLVQAVLPTAQ